MSVSSTCLPNIVWDIASRAEWSVRLVGIHPVWSAPASRGCCSSLSSGAALRDYAEPHHLLLSDLGWTSRLPYMCSDDCGSSAGVSWLGAGARAPRSIIGFWGWPPPRSGSLGPIAVTDTGALYSPRLDVLYSQHPEYHAPPPCGGPAARALLALRDGVEAAAAGLRSCRSAVVVMQAYAASYWHLLLEVAPRLLMALPLLPRRGNGGGAGDSGCKLLAPRTAASLELVRLLGISEDAVIAVPPGGAVLVTERLAFATTSPFSWHSLPPRRWIVDVRAAVLAAATVQAATATTRSFDRARGGATATAALETVTRGGDGGDGGGDGGGGSGGGGGGSGVDLLAACDELVVFSLRSAREASGLDEARRLLDEWFAKAAQRSTDGEPAATHVRAAGAGASAGAGPGAEVVAAARTASRLCTAAVRADDLPLTEQIRLFGATDRGALGEASTERGERGERGDGGSSIARRRARRLRAIVGSHGANLVHALWAAPPCAIVEVVPPPPRPAFANYQHLAAALGLDHLVVPAHEATSEGKGDGGIGADGGRGFAVEPDLVLRVVLEALGLGGTVSSKC